MGYQETADKPGTCKEAKPLAFMCEKLWQKRGNIALVLRRGKPEELQSSPLRPEVQKIVLKHMENEEVTDNMAALSTNHA